MEATHDIYTNYHAMTAEISEGLSRMAEYCAQLDMPERAAALQQSKHKLQSHKFAVGIVGEFKRGKSTVINSLLGKEIMPADILPATATMNRVTYDLQARAQLHLRDGSVQDIPVDELPKYVTKYSEETAARAAGINEAVVYYPCRFCQNGVDIVDTPGLNDDEYMNKVTEETIPKLDAVIMVLVPDNPFSMSEADFVRTKLMCSDVGRLIFLVNKIDMVKKKDRQRAVDGIREKIKQTVLEKTRDVYGEESQQFAAVQAKLADIRVYPISARDALEGRMGEGEDEEENEKLIAGSGILKFEQMLSHMLTEERGVLELSGPVIQIFRSGEEAKTQIKAFMESLNMDNESFQAAQRQLLAAQNKLKQEQEAEKSRLHEKSQALSTTLRAKVNAVYREIEEAAEDIVQAIQLPGDTRSLTDELKQGIIERAMTKVNQETQTRMSNFCERTAAEVNEIVGQEAIQTAGVVTEGQISLSMDGLMNKGSKDTVGTMVGHAAAALVEFSGIYGLNGVISGYQEAGLKGALVGGAGGLAVNILLCNLVLLPLTGGAVIPAYLLSAAAGGVASKGISKLLFGKSKTARELEELRAKISDQVKEGFRKMRQEQVLENWVENTVNHQFDALCETMEEQCESTIRDAQASIDRIKMDLARNAADKKVAQEQYQNTLQAIDELLATLEPIRQKLLQAHA